MFSAQFSEINQAIFSVQNLQNIVMRTILLLRHAQAVLPDSSGKDFDRQLSSAGKTDALQQAERLIKSGIMPDFILCSPALRTLQTAEIFSAAITSAFPEISITPQCASSLYRANASGYLYEIREQAPQDAQCVLLVGHNPSIEDCALLFAQPDSPLAQRIGYGFPTAGVAQIETNAEYADITPENARLTALFLPQED